VSVNKLRKILYPFSLLYGEIVGIRNKAYEKKIFKSTSFEFPIIVVGNLNVGGTGKSPQIEYLIRLLKDTYKIAVLSRGYKRKSKGFQIADENSTAKDIGDEPLQFHKKFKDIIVAVEADRVNALKELQCLSSPPEVVLLDDAFQHLKVNPGFTILLTSYENLYVDDTMLPAGNLREKREGAKRANIIVVTKCPAYLSAKQQFEIAKKLEPELYQTIFFSTISYDDNVFGTGGKIAVNELKDYKVLLVTGIANCAPLVDFLESKNVDFKHLRFADHHFFTNSDKEKIKNELEALDAIKKIILTTEKDYVRTFSENNNQTYYLPIRTKFIENGDDFDKLILNYVRQNTRNS
jgi:tetraacyldisaccharide 4'-kinase